jgi:hypothetical protein
VKSARTYPTDFCCQKIGSQKLAIFRFIQKFNYPMNEAWRFSGKERMIFKTADYEFHRLNVWHEALQPSVPTTSRWPIWVNRFRFARLSGLSPASLSALQRRLSRFSFSTNFFGGRMFKMFDSGMMSILRRKFDIHRPSTGNYLRAECRRSNAAPQIWIQDARHWLSIF